MRHYLLFPLLTAFLFLAGTGNVSAQSADSVTTIIKGIGPGYMKGQQMFLMRRGNLGEVKDQIVDSTWIGSDTTFAITHHGKRGQMLVVYAGVSDAPVIMEQGTVDINLQQPDGNLGGTPLNDALRQYTKASGEILRERGLADGVVDKDSTLTKEEKTAKFDSITKAAQSKAVALAIPIIKRYKDTELAEYAMSECLRWTGEDIILFDSLYDAMGRRQVTMPRLRQTIARMENIRQTMPGKMFRDFTVKDGNLDGTPVSLSDYVGKGKFVLLDFWASWCIWCRAEFPTLAKVYAKHKDDNFDIVGLVVDDKLDDTKKALEKETMVTWPQIVNAGKKERNLYGVEGIPEIILFSPDGHIIARGLRGERLVKTVDAALAE